MVQLSSNEIRIFFSDIPFQWPISDTNIIYQILSAAEAKRCRRFRFSRDKNLYLFTRALLRLILSEYTGIEPFLWRFSENQFGRPEIEYPVEFKKIRFNVSHTHSMAAIALTQKKTVGIDIERINKKLNYLSIAERFFSQAESRILNNLPPDQGRLRFVEYWTLKEAYTKAKGMGLSLPFDQFCFHLNTNSRIQVKFCDRIQDCPENWKFIQFYPTANYCISAAVHRQPGDNPKIIIIEASSIIPQYLAKATNPIL